MQFSYSTQLEAKTESEDICHIWDKLDRHKEAVFAAVVVSVPVAFLNEKIIDSYY